MLAKADSTHKYGVGSSRVDRCPPDAPGFRFNESQKLPVLLLFKQDNVLQGAQPVICEAIFRPTGRRRGVDQSPVCRLFRSQG